jgi:hypothetical protein
VILSRANPPTLRCLLRRFTLQSPDRSPSSRTYSSFVEPQYLQSPTGLSYIRRALQTAPHRIEATDRCMKTSEAPSVSRKRKKESIEYPRTLVHIQDTGK